MTATRMLKYIEQKSGQSNRGPAWIARVTPSKTGRTLYFNGMALKRAIGGGISGNHFDSETGDEYWVSGVKKDGRDRHWAGSGIVWIEEGAVAEYLRVVGATELTPRQFQVIEDCPAPALEELAARENTKLR